MAEQSNQKRVTQADILVVGIVCLLLIVLVPVLLAKPREQSIRQLCGANLGQIGKLMLLYANDHQGALPRAGGPTTMWGAVANWMATNRNQAFGLNADGNGGSATINSCFYLLVKYYKAPTRLFVCRGDQGTTEFKLSPTRGLELSDAWDFGLPSRAPNHCSYAYHFPFGPYPLTTSRDPNLAVAADRNPFLISPMADPADITQFRPDVGGYWATPEQARAGNAVTHEKDGQNVLFLDGRVTFEKRSYCGLDNDNIYLTSGRPNRGNPMGTVPVVPVVAISNDRDSVLVHDPPVFSYTAKPKEP